MSPISSSSGVVKNTCGRVVIDRIDHAALVEHDGFQTDLPGLDRAGQTGGTRANDKHIGQLSGRGRAQLPGQGGGTYSVVAKKDSPASSGRSLSGAASLRFWVDSSMRMGDDFLRITAIVLCPKATGCPRYTFWCWKRSHSAQKDASLGKNLCDHRGTCDPHAN